MTQAILGKWHLPNITFAFCGWQMRIIRNHVVVKKNTDLYGKAYCICKYNGWVNENLRMWLVQAFFFFPHTSVSVHMIVAAAQVWTCLKERIYVGPRVTNVGKPAIRSSPFLFFSSLALMVYTPFMAFRPKATHQELIIIKPMGGQLEEQPQKINLVWIDHTQGFVISLKK